VSFVLFFVFFGVCFMFLSFARVSSYKGGIRCERASALLKYKMSHDPSVQDLNIQGVYQLQGGIDKYFKEFPSGGYWQGKNYVFDKRFAHAPPAAATGDNAMHTTMMQDDVDDQKLPAAAISSSQPSSTMMQSPCTNNNNNNNNNNIMGKCEACHKPWDKYRGKRRCPTCGVPSLICRDCWQAHESGIRKLLDQDKRSVRCDLCVEQGIFSKQELRQREAQQLRAYERRMKEKGLLLLPAAGAAAAVGSETSNHQPDGKKTMATSTTTAADANPNGGVTTTTTTTTTTRLFLKNMCRTNMTEQILVDFIPGITHVVWRIDRRRNDFFYGQAWVEMESLEAAARAVAQSGQNVLGRPLYISYQPADGKDVWPPPSSTVTVSPSSATTTSTQ
jgi:Rhodanase C-terminal